MICGKGKSLGTNRILRFAKGVLRLAKECSSNNIGGLYFVLIQVQMTLLYDVVNTW